MSREMTEEMGRYVADGAIVSGVMAARKGCAPFSNGPADWEMEQFRKQLIAALNELPRQMTAGEIIALMAEGH